MSIPSGISSNTPVINLPTAPAADKASAVQMRIQTAVGKVSDITAELSAVMKELQALEAPNHPGEDASDEAIKKYQDKLKAFQAQVKTLNKKLDALQTKLQKAKAVVQKLNTTDLPQAQRQDARAVQEWTEKSQEALEKQAEATAASTEDTSDLTTDQAKTKVRLQVAQMKKQLSVEGSESVAFKVAQLTVTVGDLAAKPATDATVTGMPKTPATGI